MGPRLISKNLAKANEKKIHSSKRKKKKEEEKAKRVVEASAHRLPPFYPLDVWA
jgi:hypothetical protein